MRTRILFLFLLSLISARLPAAHSADLHAHQLDLEALTAFFHRAAVMGVLRSKGNTLKRTAPAAEGILYAECEKAAQSPVQLARCVVALLDVRERPEDRREDEAEPRTQAELYTRMSRMLNDVLGKKQQSYPDTTNEFSSRPKKSTRSAMENLKRIHGYMSLVERCHTQMQKVNEENARFIRQAGLPIQFDLQPQKNLTAMDHVMEIKTHQWKGTRVLSPRFFSLFPSRKNRQHLLSPSLFSLHSDGPLSLPQLLQMSSIGRKETDEWIETLLNLSGAARLLQQTAEQLEPKMRELERDVYPRLRELERWERSWTRVRNTHTADQEHKFRTSNYTFLSPDQLRLLYNSPLAPPLSEEAALKARLNERQQEARLERDIRKLAKLNEEAIRKRAKRAYDGEFGPTVRPPRAQVPVFTPAGRVEERKDDRWVEISQDVEVDFGPPAHHRVHDGTIEISNKMTTVEPKKEEAEGCSPNESEPNATLCVPLSTPTSTMPTLHTPAEKAEAKGEGEKDEEKEEEEEGPHFEVLAPFAFGSKINEGVALEGLDRRYRLRRSCREFSLRQVAWILSPEALLLEVLSPKALDVRIGSPEALLIQVLSPNMLSPKIYSPEAVGLLVLSPSFISPRIHSGEKLMVEVLSPNLLGGGSHEEEGGEAKEHGEHDHEYCDHEKSTAEHDGEHPPAPHKPPHAMRDWT